MTLFFYICLHYSFHKHIQRNFYELGNYLVEDFSRQPDRLYQVESAPCDRNVLIRICFVAKTGLD